MSKTTTTSEGQSTGEPASGSVADDASLADTINTMEAKKDIGSLFYALAELTNSKAKALIISDCFQDAIDSAMDKNEIEVAAMFADLRRQLI